VDVEKLLDGRLKLRHLRLVAIVADHGSIVRAAESLHVTQPVVTRGIHEVEAILGVPLFERHSRGVRPTVFGDVFADHARAVLAQVRQAGRQLDLLVSAQVGAVTVGTHLAGASRLLPRTIITLKAELPDLTVVVRESTPDALQAGLLDGEIDLVVGRLRATVAARLQQEPLYQEPVRLIARRGHPVHERTAPTLAELTGYAWILPVDQTELRLELEQLFVQEGVPLPANRIECTSMPTLRSLLLDSDVIAALPMLIVDTEEGLQFISTPLPTIRRAVGVTRVAETVPSPPAAAMLRHVRAAAASLRQTLGTDHAGA